MTTKAGRNTQSSSTSEPANRRRRKVAKTKLTKTATPKIRKGGVKPTVTNTSGFSVVLRDVLTSVPNSARDGFVRTVVGDPSDGLDTALWGPGPSPAERKEAALANLRLQYESRRQVVEASLTRTEAAELLDISQQAVLDRLEAGDLIGLKKGREWRLPAWQFSPDAERGFVPGLARLRKVFPGGAVSMTEWATSPNVELEGATPADELAAGHVDVVVHAASTGTAAAW
jgi:hypothetical protein